MNRRNFALFGLLMVLGAVYESLYVVGVLPFSVLSGAFFFTPQTMPPLVLLTVLGGIWLLLKGARGFGDMMLAPDAIVTPGRTVRQVLRRVPGLLPLDRVTGVQVSAKATASRVVIRYRSNSGQERQLVVPSACIPDPTEFLSELGRRGVPVSVDT